MPDLGDFLGALLGELASARLNGDLETLRIADIYASHELLKHLPVPRFRLPEVRVDLPAIVEEGAGKKDGGVDVNKTGAIVLGAVQQKLEERQIPLTKAEASLFGKVLGQVLERSFATPVPPPAAGIAEEVVRGLRAAAPRLEKDEHGDTFLEVKRDVTRHVAVARAAAAHISILPHTGAVKEVPDPDRLIRVHLLVSEEAVEWTVLDIGGSPRERLVQE